jgi:ATP-binding cassette subfamily B protein
MTDSQKTNQTRQQMRPGMMRPMSGRPLAAGNDRAKHFGRTMKQLLRYLQPFWARLGVVVVLAIGSTIFTIIGPRLLGDMTNKVVDGYVATTAYDKITAQLPKEVKLPAGTTGKILLQKLPAAQLKAIPSDQRDAIAKIDFSKGRPQYDFAGIANLAIWLLVMFAVSALFGYAQSWLMADIVQQVTYRLRRDIATKINKLPLSYFDKQPFGEVLSRVTNDVDTVGQNLNQSITQIITSIIMIIGVTAMMLSISWQLTLIAVVVIPLSLISSLYVIKHSQRYFMNQQNTLAELNGHIEEMFSGHTVMQAFSGQGRSISRFKRLNHTLFNNSWRAIFLSGLLMPITQFIGNLGFVGVAVTGGWLAIHGSVNLGDILAFIQYVNLLNQPITQAANIANVLQLAAAAAERVFEFLAEAEESTDPADYVALQDIKGEVDFNHVVFGYVPGKNIIKNFTASIKPGMRIAIVGPTGAGKTTLVNLLMRFYDVKSGSITIDGVDTRDMRRADVRKLFGMVLQDTWLFNGSIKDNLAYGKEVATMEEIVEAAKAAHADGFIRALPGGYNMVLDENADNLAQGEKQLLTLARAMLANPPMLILDEATSSVDTRTEVLIQAAMDKLMHGRTSFVIAHRLSTIRGADLILVMHNGNIVESGTHESLLAANGFYADLYNSQFVGAIVEENGTTSALPAAGQTPNLG